ncbi:hypothetical protein ANCCEY_03803 [Ancylostoma ceylanicum]|uniref:Major facilitator superfamily (MFS) profile domain-containing protein n=1 Tax=Ancylostoma ceylanicum TaxID=53326 RepID=A0A0D6MAP3_9BILA|nr:hypothetical protein ANCCEY_03803 [Ancylostoma ceylanicum]
MGRRTDSTKSGDPSREPLQAGEDPGPSKWPTWNLAKTALVVSIGGGFNFGYQLLITNPAQEALIQFLNDSYAETHGIRQDRVGLEFIWGIIISSFFWGATVGALMIQTISDRLGRNPVACRGLISMSTGVMLQVGLVVGSITAMPEYPFGKVEAML